MESIYFNTMFEVWLPFRYYSLLVQDPQPNHPQDYHVSDLSRLEAVTGCFPPETLHNILAFLWNGKTPLCPTDS